MAERIDFPSGSWFHGETASVWREQDRRLSNWPRRKRRMKNRERKMRWGTAAC